MLSATWTSTDCTCGSLTTGRIFLKAHCYASVARAVLNWYGKKDVYKVNHLLLPLFEQVGL